jgi:hypothetical protein
MNIEQRLLRDHGIETIETDERLAIDPAFTTRFRGRAERKAAKLNSIRVFPSYRYEVVRERGRYLVVAMQNIARKNV